MPKKPHKEKIPKVHGEYALSAKRLAELNTPHVCERCFWIRNQMHGVGRDAPYSFPVAGLLSRIDSMEKKLVKASPELPAFLDAYKGQELVELHRMSHIDERTGIELTGVPDLAFRKPNREISVIDLKSSKPKDMPASGDEESFAKVVAIYGAQLHVYKYLLEKRGEGKVTSLSIMSLWPETLVGASGGISIEFKACEQRLSVDETLISRLLERARKILISRKIPTPTKDCLDCIRTAHFLSILGVESPKDEAILENITIAVP